MDSRSLCDLLTNSSPGSRTPAEIDQIGCSLQYLPCVPRDVLDRKESLAKLAMNVDCVLKENGGVIYIQGEIGSCVHVLLQGSVNAYFESDSDVEDCMRSCLSSDSVANNLITENEENTLLGKHCGNIQVGEMFGEYALLSKEYNTNKQGSSLRKSGSGDARAQWGTRAYTAVAQEGTILLRIPETVYLKLVARHGVLQSETVRLAVSLSSLPLFQQSSFASLVQTVSRGDRVVRPYNTRLASYLDPISEVYLVLSGEVRVRGSEALSPRGRALGEGSSCSGVSVTGSVEAGDAPWPIEQLFAGSAAAHSMVGGSVVSGLTLPAVSIATLKPGQVVGESEVRKGLAYFKFDYEAHSLRVELLRLPCAVYAEALVDCAFLSPASATSRTALSEEERQRRMERRAVRLAEVWEAARQGGTEFQLPGEGDSVAIPSLDSLSAGFLQEFTGSMLSGSLAAHPPPLSTRPSLLGKVWVGQPSQVLSPRRAPQVEFCPYSPRERAVAGPHVPPAWSPRTPPRSQQAPGRPSPRAVARAGKSPRTSKVPPPAEVPGVGAGLQGQGLGQGQVGQAEPIAEVMYGTSQGPDACLEYAVTPAEAARNVQEELLAIRRRLGDRKRRVAGQVV